MTDLPKKPSYEDVIAYYMREDVSEFFWRLAQSRQLKFFHHCETDPQARTRARPQAIAVHCPATVAELCERVETVAGQSPDYPYAFFPFWGIQSSQVNVPGRTEQVLGWDMRFEFDFDLKNSFAVLLPVAAVMHAFEVPIILKYSGHRSLHLIIPAESFPLSMKRETKRETWMAAAKAIGHLCYRLAPYITTTQVGLSKEMTLTAPYSFHRYYGLLSLPLTLQQALEFDPGVAVLERFPGIQRVFPDPWAEGAGMEHLLDLAERAYSDPRVLLRIAERAFEDSAWDKFARQLNPVDIPVASPLALLMAGAVGVHQLDHYSPTIRSRLRAALLAVDHPIGKTHKFSGLVDAPLGFQQPLSNYVRQRRLRAEALSTWAMKGLGAALDQLCTLAAGNRASFPVLLATRLYALLPETSEQLTAQLLRAWQAIEEVEPTARLFLALALGERCGGNNAVLQALAQHPHDPGAPHFRQLLFESGEWQAEARPDLVLATLVLVLGEEQVRSWALHPDTEAARAIIQTAFNGHTGKFVHSARRVGFGA